VPVLAFHTSLITLITFPPHDENGSGWWQRSFLLAATAA
jgi:hypothetical protein